MQFADDIILLFFILCIFPSFLDLCNLSYFILFFFTFSKLTLAFYSFFRSMQLLCILSFFRVSRNRNSKKKKRKNAFYVFFKLENAVFLFVRNCRARWNGKLWYWIVIWRAFFMDWLEVVQSLRRGLHEQRADLLPSLHIHAIQQRKLEKE